MSNRLPMLQAEIAELHRRGEASQQAALDAYREAGVRLIEAKALLGHGQWLPWLAEIGISPRTAQHYMRLARLSADKYATVSHLGLRKALDAIAAEAAYIDPQPDEEEKELPPPLAEGEFYLPIDDVKFRADLYPRTESGSDDRMINWYAEILRWLPAIEINQRDEIIDGYMRWVAHKRAKKPMIRVRVTEVESDFHHLELAIRRNATHGIPMINQFDIESCRQYWRDREAKERLEAQLSDDCKTAG